MSAPPQPADSPNRPKENVAPIEVASSSSSSSSQSQPSPLIKPSKPFTCLVVGATGATGRVLVEKLANNPRVERIQALVRRELADDFFGKLLPANKEKIQTTVVDFDKLADHADAFKGYNTAFCTLGTTRAKAGSKEEFRRVDYGYITEAARLAKAAGCYHFSLMSTTGADHTSKLFAYLRVKGEIEQNLMNEAKFPSLSIFRPGLLLTDRQNETRWGEYLAQKIVPVFHKILPERNCAVHTQTVAEAMMQNAEFVLASVERENGGVEGAEQLAVSVGASKTNIFENEDIRAMKVAKL